MHNLPVFTFLIDKPDENGEIIQVSTIFTVKSLPQNDEIVLKSQINFLKFGIIKYSVLIGKLPNFNQTFQEVMTWNLVSLREPILVRGNDVLHEPLREPVRGFAVNF